MSPAGRYRPSPRGTAELMQSQMIGRAMLSVADDMSSQANQAGRSTYQAHGRTVTGGRSNAERAGAEVVEMSHDYRDSRDRVLVNLSQSYRMRGGA